MNHTPNKDNAVSLTGLARAALSRYACDSDATIDLINLSENATFLVEEPRQQRRSILRLHRPGYNSRQRIESELAWMAALRRDIGLPTPVPMPTTTGEMITVLSEPGAPPRHCVRFVYLPGTTPDEDDLVDHAETLGAISARMHNHAETWQRPDDFERLYWDYDHSVGARPNWGDWRRAPDLDPTGHQLLEMLVERLKSRLNRYGQARNRFGLIHADMRVANLVVHDDRVHVIDFDDCGMGWFLYDLATALSFMEERPDVPDLIARWLTGYARARTLHADDLPEIPTFLMLRRMIILAWIGSHAETDLAKSLGAAYTAGTCRLADQFLRGAYLSDLA